MNQQDQVSGATAATIRLRARVRELRALLGNKCAKCPNTTGLEFDCVIPQGWVKHGNGGRARLRFYQQQHLNGNLQLLCKACNCSKAIQDAIILRRARESASSLQAALTGPPPSPESVKPPAPAQIPTQRPNESDWQFQCRLMRIQLGQETP